MYSIVEMSTINIDALICFRCDKPQLVFVGGIEICRNCGLIISGATVITILFSHLGSQAD